MSRYLYHKRAKGGKKFIDVSVTQSPCCTVGKIIKKQMNVS